MISIGFVREDTVSKEVEDILAKLKIHPLFLETLVKVCAVLFKTAMDLA